MPIDEKVISDLNDNRQKAIDLATYLDKLYYTEGFINLFNKPVISLLVTAATYLSDNLEAMKQRYIERNT